ncbi:hypothetical protein A3A74_05660 [Candidatus Roizmanbacteria bacterium RIFCSPLOWO2_01_FULL_35_13]|uniref:Glycosyltransferase RgtA/B/C/D-like domain-containing protein n=1 Tax=Candidatus Roizmanbacteria bacterium RIFCSPLOWO2_01_FULL_35_13 TaxID=1802055 RepID=A0A1F7I734_9BACT|nr:MAG: hypothetical protein A3A74_05660 [Candidatus Roizmanbacteria bacterium RIFCSPLOWO2_01_FULL_35_13]
MKIEKKQILLLLVFIFLYIFIRFVNFTGHLNFSFDQAWTSTRALEIWRNKELTLVGPGSSIVTGGKQILQGSINYYFLLVFLLLGNFEPLISSYLFMIFTALMIIPLFYGVKLLFNQKAAILIISLYSLLPLYIDFSRFFFGPNFQFSLIPFLILFTGFYKKTKKQIYLFLVFFMIGVISQFHFATLIFFPIFLVYVNTRFRFIVALSGFLLGFSPIIIFELKNKFYNLVVFLEYLKNSKSLANFQLLPHRYLSLSLILFIFLAGYLRKKITDKIIFVSCLLFLVVDLLIYFPKPKNAFGMADNWNYPMEKKAYEIIKKAMPAGRQENLQDFNIVNLVYDNLSVVIKYQMKKDNYLIDFDDYYHNKYLFVINKNENIFNNPAYEVNTFKPRKKLNQWKLNDSYYLYLFERLK